MNLVSKLAKSYVNTFGWKTHKKIIVIESDDWGSVRMPNKEVLSILSAQNSKILNDRYSLTDSIANVTDLEKLFEILKKFKDFKGNSPVISANTIVGNPDFKKIKKSNFNSYYYETFDNTIKKLPEGNRILTLWNEGIDSEIFKPQLHGREHLHALLWLEELKLGNKDLLAAFELKCFGVPYHPILINKRKNLMSALDKNGFSKESSFHENYIKDASNVFRTYFGYTAKSFIAPTYIWHPKLEKALKESGIEYIQGLPIQYIPSNSKNKFRKKLHYTGQKNSLNQLYLTRNVFFEPTSNSNIDWVSKALVKIDQSFKNRLPAIIGSHRINYIGSLVPDNRDKNLKLLGVLLMKILQKWPDVEFMSSDVLGELIINEKSS